MTKLLSIEVNEETGKFTMSAPPRDEALAMFKRFEETNMVWQIDMDDSDRDGMAMLFTLAHIIGEVRKKMLLQQAMENLKEAGADVLTVSLDDIRKKAN